MSDQRAVNTFNKQQQKNAISKYIDLPLKRFKFFPLCKNEKRQTTMPSNVRQLKNTNLPSEYMVYA